MAHNNDDAAIAVVVDPVQDNPKMSLLKRLQKELVDFVFKEF